MGQVEFSLLSSRAMVTGTSHALGRCAFIHDGGDRRRIGRRDGEEGGGRDRERRERGRGVGVQQAEGCVW